MVILKKLKIAPSLIALTILYWGFSPALVNTAFSLYSEIITYPIVLSIILLTAQCWGALQTRLKSLHIFAEAVVLGLLLTLLTFVKGIFEAVTPFLLLPYCILAVRTIIKKEKYLSRQTLVFLMIIGITFYGLTISYKMANKKYNGIFTLTDRGPWALYGNTARRLEQLTVKRWLVAVTYASSKELCRDLFPEKECTFWSPEPSDFLSHKKLAELRKTDMSPNEINQALIKLSLQVILKNPAQYLLLMGLENFKMLFWESTKMEVVAYPDWIERLYGSRTFSYGITFFMALLTFLALLHLSKSLFSLRKAGLSPAGPDDESRILLAWMFLFIVPFLGMHSFFHILPRYILPIAPLYLVLIAFFLQAVKNKIKKSGDVNYS